MKLELILGVLKEGLKLWNTKEGSKYLDRVIKLEKEYHEEFAKNEDDRSQLFLDSRLLELKLIATNFVKFASKK